MLISKKEALENQKKTLDYYQRRIDESKKAGDEAKHANNLYGLAGIQEELKQHKEALLSAFESYARQKKLPTTPNIEKVTLFIQNFKRVHGKDPFYEYAAYAFEKLSLALRREINIDDFINEPAEKRLTFSRNEVVKVKYTNGDIVERKYKHLASDLQEGKCHII